MKIVQKNKYLVFFVLTVLQISIIIFWGTKKENYYWDEFFTFERAHYCSDSTPGEHYIDVDPEYEYEKWLPVKMIHESLVVTKEQSVLNDSLISTARKFIKQYNYSILLNIMETWLAPGKLSIWPSVILNIIIFVLNQIVIFSLCSKIYNNSFYALAVAAFYGFSSMCVSMTIFIRFYMCATLLTSLFVFLHYQYYKTEDSEHLKRILFLGLSGLVLLCAYNNSQFVIIFGAFFILVFSVSILIKQGMRRFVYYAVPIYGGGLAYLHFKTNYLLILTDFQKVYEQADGALGWCLNQIISFRPYMLPRRIFEMSKIWGRYAFGSFFVMILFIFVFIVMSIIHKKLIKLPEKEGFNVGFVFVIACSLFMYMVFFTTFKLYEQVRYISYTFPMIAVLVISMAFNTFTDMKKNSILAVILIVACVLSVNIKGKVDMLYPGDAENIKAIQDVGSDSIILLAGRHTTIISYEAALMVDKDAEFYVYNSELENAENNAMRQLRNKMLIMEYAGEDNKAFLERVKENGYNVEFVGHTYQYNVYSALAY